MKKIVLWICTVVMTLIASACIAGAYSPYFEAEPPREVREHVANRWPDYEFEDYCEVRGTPKGDYGFALVHRKNERILVGYHKVDGEMKYWLKNAGAVPQGKEEAWFDVGTAGWKDETDWVGNSTGRQVYDDGLCFFVTQLDVSGESYEKMVMYRWENGMFRLNSYHKSEGGSIRVSDDKLDFIDWSNGVYRGAVQGAVQRDIRYVSFNALPMWIDDAKEKLTTAPILVSPDWEAPFELMCDASYFVFGAALGPRRGKRFHPIYFASKMLNDTQKNYTTTEKELLAIVFAFEKFDSI